MIDGALGELALGEFSVSSIIPPIPPVQVNPGAGILRKKRKIEDEDELLVIISQHIGTTLWKNDKNNH